MDNDNLDILKYPLTVLQRLGLYSVTKNKTVILIASSYAFVLFFILITALMQFSNVENVFDFVSNLEGISGFGQHCSKIVVITYQQQKLTRLIKCTKSFWSTDMCPQKMKTQLDELRRNNLRLQIFFFCITTLTVLFIVVSPVFGKAVPLGAWNIENEETLRKVAMISQMTVLLPICFFIIAFDCSFVAFSVEAIIQFRILSCCLRGLNTSEITSVELKAEYDAKMKSCIHHHTFLLGYLRALQEMYSPVIFAQYLTTIPLICTEMYALLESNDPNSLLKYGIGYLTVIMQLALYCIPADFVTSEALLVSNAVYDSNWHSQYVYGVRESISLIIQKSQQEFVFTAGGLFEINSRTLITALKLSWSACTVMRTLKAKS